MFDCEFNDFINIVYQIFECFAIEIEFRWEVCSEDTRPKAFDFTPCISLSI